MRIEGPGGGVAQTRPYVRLRRHLSALLVVPLRAAIVKWQLLGVSFFLTCQGVPCGPVPNARRVYSDDTDFCPRDGARLAAQATETEAQLAAGLSRRFRIVRRLGAGGMGAVFLAEQIGVGNRPVALKVLSRKLLDDPEFLLRFQNEAASTGRIHHPNVVTIYESGQADDGTPYIAMEFLEGESLRQALARRGALPVPEVAEILQQAARGLNAAHKLGIIHRDLKPDNIFLTRGDEGELIVKVVDFGIAKLRESATHTQTGMVLGTPAYMSCEQASGMRSDELDARSDVYSLGVVVYEMLTGRVPFHSDTPLGYLRKHMLEDPPPFRAVAPGLGVAPAVESAVMKALAKDRDQRYASVLDFARALAGAVSPVRQGPVTAPLAPTKVAPPPRVNSAPPSARVASPPSARQPAAPPPPSGWVPVAPQTHPAGTPARAGAAVQTPPPTPAARIDEASGTQTFSGRAAVVEPIAEPLPAVPGTRFGDKVTKAVRSLVKSIHPRTSLLTGGILILLTLFLPVAYQSCDPSRTGLEFVRGGSGSLPMGILAGGLFSRQFYAVTLVLAAVAIVFVLLSALWPGLLRGRRSVKLLFGVTGTVSLILLSSAVITALTVCFLLIRQAAPAMTIVVPSAGIIGLGIALSSASLRSSKFVLVLLAAGCIACVLLLTDFVVALSVTDGYLPSSVKAWQELPPLLYWFVPSYLWFRHGLFSQPGEQGQWLKLRSGIVKFYLPCILAVPVLFWLCTGRVWGFIPLTVGCHLLSLGYMQLANGSTEQPSLLHATAPPPSPG